MTERNPIFFAQKPISTNYRFLHKLTRNKNNLTRNGIAAKADEDEEDDDEDEKMEPVSARPRRMSEVSTKKGKKPIPKGSAFFIFSHTNK